MALWTSDGGCDATCDNSYSEAQRLTVTGGPVFSLLLDRRSDDGLADQVYLGTHGKQVSSLKFLLGDHFFKIYHSSNFIYIFCVI